MSKRKLPEPAVQQKKLFKWFRRSKRDLPWRHTEDPYKIWISEIMLQQTTVATVIPYYKRWVETFPDIRSLANARTEKILKVWEGLGYYERARNIKKCALFLVERFEAKLPGSYRELIKLPGIGSYTAGAVMSIAFGKRFPVLDANVKRVVMRLLMLRGGINSKDKKRIEEFLEQLLPEKNVGIFNQALMELGAIVCRPKSPSCPDCPFNDFCLSYEKGVQETIPALKKKDYKKIHAVLAIIQKRGKILIQKRPSTGLMAGLFEFPSFEKKRGETSDEAIKRGIEKELGDEILKKGFLGKVGHAYTSYRVSLDVYFLDLKKGSIQKSSLKRIWAAEDELGRYPFTSGSAKALRLFVKA